MSRRVRIGGLVAQTIVIVAGAWHGRRPDAPGNRRPDGRATARPERRAHKYATVTRLPINRCRDSRRMTLPIGQRVQELI